MTLLPAQRRQRILEDIRHGGAGMVAHLSEKYGVSEMTIRRDLIALEEGGLVKRTHGGAIRPGNGPLLEPRIINRESRQKLFALRKASIARYAAHELTADGDILILEGGTTVSAMAQYLTDRQGLTVVTNGLDTASELRRFLPNTTIICAGGILRVESSTFVGPVSERFFREFHANKLFLSATGFTLTAGVTDPSMLETQVKKAMIASASEVILLLDSSKFGVKSLMTVLALEEICSLVTDELASVEMLQELKARGVDVHLAPAL